MKITVLYLRILKKYDPNFPEHKSYAESSQRFLNSYQQFKPQTPHELVVVNCGQDSHDGMFKGVASGYRTYSGGGYDCGTYQAVAPSLDCNLVLALNTHTYFWKQGWLEPFVNAFKAFGEGVYGASGSYEGTPHLRTPSIAFTPQIMVQYPIFINSRDEAAEFEAGPANFTFWAGCKGYPVMMVTGGGVYPIQHWRTPPNIFRRGNQSNVLIKDRHTDIYDKANATEKAELERAADGK